jgi:hypothetical protein
LQLSLALLARCSSLLTFSKTAGRWPTFLGIALASYQFLKHFARRDPEVSSNLRTGLLK